MLASHKPTASKSQQTKLMLRLDQLPLKTTSLSFNRNPDNQAVKQGSAVASERKHVIRTMNTTSNSAGGGESEMNQAADPRPYKAQVEVIFPTPTQAKHAMDVLSVDGELGDKVVKTFAIAPSTEGDDKCGVIMRV